MGMLDQLYSADAVVAERAPLLGLARTAHHNQRGQPLGFADKPFLVELYAQGPSLDEIVVRKAVQVGVTEWLILLCLHAAGWKGRFVAYAMPTFGVRDRFVQTRINPLLAAVSAYRERLPGGAKDLALGPRGGAAPAASVRRKRFGQGSLLFLGSNSDGDWVEFSSDMLVVDEYDQCDQINLAKGIDRLREAKGGKQRVLVGNPTQPRFGISKLYGGTDKRRWHHTCASCGERQPLEWEVNVVVRGDDGVWRLRDTDRVDRLVRLRHGAVDVAKRGDVRPICRRCRRPFERRAMAGQWVSEVQERVVRRGYHMSRLDCLSDRLVDLYAEFIAAQGNTAKLGAFFAGVLGLPYEHAGSALTDSELDAVSTGGALDYIGGDTYGAELVTAGIDVGSVLNVQVSVVRDVDGKPARETRWVGATTSFDDVRDILIRYRARYAVIDAAPETREAKRLRDHFREADGATQVWLCRLTGGRSGPVRVGDQEYGMSIDWNDQVVTCDRTQLVDAATDDFRCGRRVLPVDVRTVLGWAEQMRAPKRVVDFETGRVKWSEGDDPDHYRFADVYDRVASDLSQYGATLSWVG